MTLGEILNIVAIALSPIIAIQVSEILSKRKQKRERRLYIFRTLMATRAMVLDRKHVEALNLIDIEFYDNDRKCQEVINAWKDYQDHLNTPNINHDIWIPKGRDLLVELLYKMALALGYKYRRSDFRQMSYVPMGWAEQEQDQNKVLKGLSDVFDGKKSIPIVFPEPTSAEDKSKAQNIIDGLEQILTGKKSIAVTRMDNE